MTLYVQGVSVMLYEPSEALVTGNSWPDVPTAFRLTPARGAPPAASVTVPEIHPGAGTNEMAARAVAPDATTTDRACETYSDFETVTVYDPGPRLTLYDPSAAVVVEAPPGAIVTEAPATGAPVPESVTRPAIHPGIGVSWRVAIDVAAGGTRGARPWG